MNIFDPGFPLIFNILSINSKYLWIFMGENLKPVKNNKIRGVQTKEKKSKSKSISSTRALLIPVVHCYTY